MSNKLTRFIQNFSLVFLSNIISVLISTVVVLIVPNVIGTTGYGYWQLYIFYTTYVGTLHFGWADGIYLRYGGKEYQSLDKALFSQQFWIYSFFHVAIAIIITILSFSFFEDKDRLFIMLMTAVCLVFTGIRTFVLFIFQTTNRIKEYSLTIIIGRIIYFSLIIILILLGVNNYKLLIYSDLFERFIVMGLAIYLYRDILSEGFIFSKTCFKEIYENVSVGIKLMFANIASSLLIGVVKFGIEKTWNIETFGKISLSLNVTNIFLQFINAVGIVLFPVLRRARESNLPIYYDTIRNILMPFSFGALLSYYPGKLILSILLPQYLESFKFLAILFPVCIFEGKMALLVNTYLKTLRKEKLMFYINASFLAISIVFTIITTYLLKTLVLSIFSILLLLFMRSTISEIILSKELKLNYRKDLILEFAVVFIFVISSWYINSWLTLLIYGFSYIVYLFIKRKDIVISIQRIKSLK